MTWHRITMLLLTGVALVAGEADAWRDAGLPLQNRAEGGFVTTRGQTLVIVPAQERALPDAPAAVSALLNAVAQIDGAPLWTLRRGMITGWSLRRADVMVCAAGVLRRTEVPDGDDAGVLLALTAARDLAVATIDPVLGAAANAGLRRQLARLDKPGNHNERRLVASAWSEGLIGTEARSALSNTIQAADQPHLREAWVGDGLRLERYADAWHRETWIWRSADRLAYATPTLQRAHRTQAPMRLVVDLPLDANPWHDVSTALSASLYLGTREIAHWDGQTVQADPTMWRLGNAPGADTDIPGWPAPAIALTAPDGRLDSLLIGQRRIAAPADGGADAEAFLDRVAVLRDPAELAALGDLIFDYTYDSPDPAIPRLIGDEAHYADIHQTAAATLSTALDGRFRGDCDDLAEMYTTILARQGRLAHVLDFGNHAAAGFLEHDADGWTMRVLHSGPAMQWTAERPEDAVLAAYAALDLQRARPRRAEAVGVLLRFAGENTRSPWVLSWRIFADPVYAATMIAVQRDWHYRTYHHGIAAMEGLLAAGDRDLANLSELTGLHRRMRDWTGALHWHREKMAASGGGSTYDRCDEVRYLTEAGQHAEAGRAALAVAEALLPDLAARDAVAAVRLAADLACRLDATHAAADRAAIIERWIAPWFERNEADIRQWIDNHFDAATWAAEPTYLAYGDAGVLLAGDRLQRWRDAGRRVGTPDWRWLDRWYGRICALPTGKRANPLWGVSAAGFWLQERLGEAMAVKLVAAAHAPTTWDGLSPRFDGFLATPRTTSWLHVSVPWWEERIAAAARLDPGPERDASLRSALAGLDEALAALPGLGLANATWEELAIRSRLIAALALDDTGLFESSLSAIAARHDREQDEASATILGSWGGALPPARFAVHLERWHDVIGNHAFALEIAWSALHAERWAAARMAAADAARRFAADPAVVAEAAQVLKRIPADP